ncbi:MULTISPECIES: dicarboxylate/amino acid:cation symporter [unclassified Halanaerobium]|uniref:dicarboxylate/amino acid:cation symporter n=1 Tax=unclassified Halanaerobium TaxID=2641197 RepID=UPI000DF1692A|nr:MULTISPECIES: dicarboxylate/amino acid:cation symporter [unclassified Halanaerobium]RCW46625.1 Na+/H+-dicarboxylate symporter [Halanaerobium sp. MA284_MarDTE_T2]RCW83473.1 Na+/H+-dicarboxylate symporter [Halanaerobium sp. DL-01]
MKKLGLVPRLLIGIIIGIIIGMIFPTWMSRLIYTFTHIFGEFLNYIVPFVILAFIIPGIAELGDKAGKLLGSTVLIAYGSTITAGTIAYLIASRIVPAIVKSASVANPEEGGLEPYLKLEIPPLLGVMTALVTAFIIGLGINYIRSQKNLQNLYGFMNEFREIIVLVIEKVIIPFLPFHIAGVFANMAHSGTAFQTLSVFGRVFALIIAMHLGYLVLLFSIAGGFSGKNPFTSLKNMIPAYTTAIGTMSSAATIPVTLKSAKKNNISERVADFVIPLGATVHLAGSTITLTTCAIAVVLIQGGTPVFGHFFHFIVLLGVTMIAAPGVPGGAVMAALGLLTSILGFGEGATALMIGLYLAQDSFGTACNVTGDGAIAIIVDSLRKKSREGVNAA